MQTMYPGQANSPQTELSAAIDSTQTTIPVLNASALPSAPNLVTIGIDDTAETVKYTGKSGNDLTGCVRGFQGAAKGWSAGTKLARNFTAYDYDALRQNVEESAPLASPTLTGIVTAPHFKSTNNTGRNFTASDWADLSANSGGQLLLANNAYTDGNNVWKYSNSHPSMGARGMRMSQSGGIEIFDTGSIATNAGDTFTPTWRKVSALDSPAFTGTPTAPTAATGTNTTQLATTAFVQKLLGASNQDVSLVKAIFQQIDTRSTALTYDASGKLTKVEEKDGSTVIKVTDLIYTSGKLTSVKEVAGGKTVTKTLAYTGNQLNGVTKAVT